MEYFITRNINLDELLCHGRQLGALWSNAHAILLHGEKVVYQRFF